MPTFEEKFGNVEARRITHDAIQEVTASNEPIIWGATLEDCGIRTTFLRDQLLDKVASKVQKRGFKMDPQFLRVVNFDSDVSFLLEGILSALPGDEDFEEPSDDVSHFQRPRRPKGR